MVYAIQQAVQKLSVLRCKGIFAAFPKSKVNREYEFRSGDVFKLFHDLSGRPSYERIIGSPSHWRLMNLCRFELGDHRIKINDQSIYNFPV